MPLHDLDLLYHALCLQIMRMYSLLSRPQPGSEVNFNQFAASILEKEIITAEAFVSSVILLLLLLLLLLMCVVGQ